MSPAVRFCYEINHINPWIKIIRFTVSCKVFSGIPGESVIFEEFKDDSMQRLSRGFTEVIIYSHDWL
jgi:hypothetical protein